jgi:hypothetical protein
VRICYRRRVRGGGTAAAQCQYHKLYRNDKKANNRSICSPQIKLTLLLIILFIHGCSQILSLPDLLEREEWDKETPELTEEKEMRLLEQGETDTSETPPVPLVPPPQIGVGENDAKMDADAAAADKVRGGGSAGTGLWQTAGGNRETNRKEKRRSVSPSESTVSKRTRTDSVSSAGTSRTSSFLPPLYSECVNVDFIINKYELII